MTEGLLWLDLDPKRDLADKVLRAADRYESKFGVRPDTCFINPAHMDGETLHVDGVRVFPMDNVLKFHFWIGIDD